MQIVRLRKTGQRSLIVLASIFCLLLTTLAASGQSQIFLSVRGTWIVDPQGRVVLLRGVNYPGYQNSRPEFHSEATYQEFARMGFNAVRLHITWAGFEPRPGVFDLSYLEYVNRDIQWAKKYGLYMVLM